MNILPIGDVDMEVVEMLRDRLTSLPFETSILDEIPVPKKAYVRARGQFKADSFLEIIKAQPGHRVLGVTDVDLYSKGRNNKDLNFIFGRAQILGKAAVISLYRLKNPRKLFHQRALKEAVHELGHTLGLRHCTDRRCVMRFSDTMEETDRKSDKFCRKCTRKLKIWGML